MIKKAPSYITSDESSFASLASAKTHELCGLLKSFPAMAGFDQATITSISTRIIENAESVVQILKTKERKPRESKAVKTKKKVKKILEDAVQGKVPA